MAAAGTGPSGNISHPGRQTRCCRAAPTLMQRQPPHQRADPRIHELQRLRQRSQRFSRGIWAAQRQKFEQGIPSWRGDESYCVCYRRFSRYCTSIVEILYIPQHEIEPKSTPTILTPLALLTFFTCDSVGDDWRECEGAKWCTVRYGTVVQWRPSPIP